MGLRVIGLKFDDLPIETFRLLADRRDLGFGVALAQKAGSIGAQHVEIVRSLLHRAAIGLRRRIRLAEHDPRLCQAEPALDIRRIVLQPRRQPIDHRPNLRTPLLRRQRRHRRHVLLVPAPTPCRGGLDLSPALQAKHPKWSHHPQWPPTCSGRPAVDWSRGRSSGRLLRPWRRVRRSPGLRCALRRPALSSEPSSISPSRSSPMTDSLHPCLACLGGGEAEQPAGLGIVGRERHQLFVDRNRLLADDRIAAGCFARLQEACGIADQHVRVLRRQFSSRVRTPLWQARAPPEPGANGRASASPRRHPARSPDARPTPRPCRGSSPPDPQPPPLAAEAGLGSVLSEDAVPWGGTRAPPRSVGPRPRARS